MPLFKKSQRRKLPAVAVGVNDKEIKALQKKLKGFPQKLQRRVLRSAVNKAATPVVKAARRELANLPYSHGTKNDGSPRPTLQRNQSKRVKTYTKTGTVVAVIGAKGTPGGYQITPHQHLVHWGVKPHPIPINKVVSIPALGGIKRRVGVIQHPGAKANPYLHRALNNSKQQIKTALVNGLKVGIAKIAKMK